MLHELQVAMENREDLRNYRNKIKHIGQP